ncbi:MAG: hypothetical protein ACFCD0_21385, partial [Gemmataceae bacterium]
SRKRSSFGSSCWISLAVIGLLLAKDSYNEIVGVKEHQKARPRAVVLSTLFVTPSSLMAQTAEAQLKLERKKYEELVNQLRGQNQKLQNQLVLTEVKLKVMAAKCEDLSQLVKQHAGQGNPAKLVEKLRRENEELRQKAKVLAQGKAAALQRMNQLLKRVRQLQAQVAQQQIKKRGLRVPGGDGIRIEGKILKVQKDYVQIDLGSDDGLSEKSVLMVYREGKQPKYLGEIQITAVKAHVAIGRRIRRITQPVLALEVGDSVTNQISNKK